MLNSLTKEKEGRSDVARGFRGMKSSQKKYEFYKIVRRPLNAVVFFVKILHPAEDELTEHV